MKIVLQNKYSLYLKTCKNVYDVEVVTNNSFNFKLKVAEITYSILITDVQEWKMPIVFLREEVESEQLRPHQLRIKKSDLVHLCLSVREDISVKNSNYKEIIDYTLLRITQLLSLSEIEEQREIRKEFLYFWEDASHNTCKVNIYAQSSKLVKIISVYKKDDKIILFDENTRVNDIIKRKWSKTTQEALYLPLVNTSNIMPPYAGNSWTNEYLIDIFNKCIEEINVDLLESMTINSRSIYIAIELQIPDILPVTALLKVTFKKSSSGNIYKRLEDIESIKHISSERCDSGYLFHRIGMRNPCKNKNILLIGAGSLGSYIVRELPQIGIENITIYDDDDFHVENNLRHHLGFADDGYKKAFAMKFDLEINNPEVNVEAKIEKFLENNLEKYSLDKFDLVIVTTGGTDFMLRLNKRFKDLAYGSPVFYAWIEANGVGVHVLPVDYSKRGCFQCLYSEGEINKAHYGKNISDLRIIGNGCGGVFNSYGNLTLLRGGSLVLELVYGHFSGDLNSDTNQLYSCRTNDIVLGKNYIFSSRDFEKSRDFYIDTECEICGT